MKTSDSLRTQPPVDTDASPAGDAIPFGTSALGGVILARASRRGKARGFLALFATFQSGWRHAQDRTSRPADARSVGFCGRPGMGALHHRSGRFHDQLPGSAEGSANHMAVAARLRAARAGLRGLSGRGRSRIRRRQLLCRPLGSSRRSCPRVSPTVAPDAPPALGPGYSRHDERGAAALCHGEAAESQRHHDGAVVGLAGHGRRSHHPSHQHCRPVTHVLERRDAPAQAVHCRRHGAQGLPEPGLFQQSLGWIDTGRHGLPSRTSATATVRRRRGRGSRAASRSWRPASGCSQSPPFGPISFCHTAPVEGWMASPSELR